MADPYQEILVVDLLGGIGDLLMLLPAVHALAHRNPGAALRVLTHEPGADLIRGDPDVTEVRTPSHGRPGAERQAVIEAVTARRPDLAITTTRYDGIPDLLAAASARCVIDLWRQPPPDIRVGDRYMRILHAEGLLGVPDLDAVPRVRLRPAELAEGRRTVAALVPSARSSSEPCEARPPVVFVTDAGMAVKRWPLPYWRQLAGVLARQGHPILGVTAVPRAPVLPLPGGSLRQLAACLHAVAERDGIVIGGDTGPVRLAAAVGARTVGLFGPTSVLRYGIGPGTSAGVDLQGLPHCPYRCPTSITEQVCWWDARCPLSPDEPACMADLSVDRVVSAVAELTGQDGGCVVRPGR